MLPHNFCHPGLEQNWEALTYNEFDIVGTLGSLLSKLIGSVFSQLGQEGINNVSAPSLSD